MEIPTPKKYYRRKKLTTNDSKNELDTPLVVNGMQNNNHTSLDNTGNSNSEKPKFSLQDSIKNKNQNKPIPRARLKIKVALPVSKNLNIRLNNYAFIDCQNLWVNKDRSWQLDWAKFKLYLSDHLQINRAYLFIGFVSGYQKMYQQMQEAGFILLFKPIQEVNGKVICNIDTEMVLQTMIQLNNFDKAVIVTGDGDFICLVDHLRILDKLEMLILPDHSYSTSLEKTAREKHIFISSIKSYISKDAISHEEVPSALIISE